MAAPRATQFIALRNVTRGGHQVRHLHMTGPATYASPVLTRERPVLNLPRDVAGLRAECKKQRIDSSGSKQDLISRLNANELIQSRAFSAVAEQPKRPAPPQSELSQPTRHFNTTRSLKAVGDSSTIDFAYLPTDTITATDDELLRVPILPNNYTTQKNSDVEEGEMAGMKPEISAMSADAVVLPMSEISDGHAMNVDFHAMADRVAANLRRMKVPVDEQAGMMKQIWADLVDDMMGAGKKGTAS